VRILDEFPVCESEARMNRKSLQFFGKSGIVTRDAQDQSTRPNGRIKRFDSGQFTVIEGRKDHLFILPSPVYDVIPDQFHRWSGGSNAFQLHVDAGPSLNKIKDFPQQGDALYLAGVQCPQMGQRFFRDVPPSAGGVLQPFVMDHHKLAFDAEYVDLDPRGAHRKGLFDGQQGVFRFVAACPPMCKTDEFTLRFFHLFTDCRRTGFAAAMPSVRTAWSTWGDGPWEARDRAIPTLSLCRRTE